MYCPLGEFLVLPMKFFNLDAYDKVSVIFHEKIFEKNRKILFNLDAYDKVSVIFLYDFFFFSFLSFFFEKVASGILYNLNIFDKVSLLLFFSSSSFHF